MIVTIKKTNIRTDHQHLFWWNSDLGRLVQEHKNPEKVIWQIMLFKGMFLGRGLFAVVAEEV